ncbi:type VI secretion protein VasK, partial [Serratia sp. S1B]
MKNIIIKLSGVLFVIIIALLLMAIFYFWGDKLGWSSPNDKLLAGGIILAISFFLSLVLSGRRSLIAVGSRLRFFRKVDEEQGVGLGQKAPQKSFVVNSAWLDELRHYLSAQYGFFWKRHIKIIMLTGQPAQVEQLVPGLTTQHWLEGQGTVLIWGGEVTDELDASLVSSLRKLRRCPLDGLVWVTDHYYQPVTLDNPPHAANLQGETMDNMARRVSERYRTLGWKIPLFVWALQESTWDQQDRISQSVGCLLPAGCQGEELAQRLTQLLPTLTEQGAQQVLVDPRHDFLLSLAHGLRHG